MSARTLLIVEDSAAMRERIRSAVDATSRIRIVGEASDASTAIDLLEQYEPDIVTLDLRLARGSSGVEVLRYLSGQARVPLVIVVSSDVAGFRRCRGHLSAVAHILDKVMDFHRLPEILKESDQAADAGPIDEIHQGKSPR